MDHTQENKTLVINQAFQRQDMRTMVRSMLHRLCDEEAEAFQSLQSSPYLSQTEEIGLIFEYLEAAQFT